MRLETMEPLQLTSLTLENFGAFRQATLAPLGALTVLVGRHGVGKSTVLGVFELMKRALRDGASEAFEKAGSFAELRHRATTEPVRFTFEFSSGHHYEIAFASDGAEVTVEHEELRLEELGLFEFSRGTGRALVNEHAAPNPEAEPDYGEFGASQPGALGLSLVGALVKNTTAARVLGFFESCTSFRPHPAAIREQVATREGGKRLAPDASNLGAILRELGRSAPTALERVMRFATHYVPGLEGVEAREEIAQHVRLWLRESGGAPLPASLASDGTLRLLSLATLLYGPQASGLLCLDEPEMELHHAVLPELVEGLRALGDDGRQVFMVTHSTDLLNAVAVDEAFVIQKNAGVSVVRAAASDANVVSLLEAGDALGALWRQGILDTTRT